MLEQEDGDSGYPTSCSSRDSDNSPLHWRIVCMWVFRDKSAPEYSLCKTFEVLTACDHTAGMDPIVSELLGMPLNLDGCYLSRGKTTPTLHFLCLQGSHAIDAVSIPSSLMILPPVESSIRIRRSSRSIECRDGRKKAARDERVLEIHPSLYAKNPYPLAVPPAP